MSVGCSTDAYRHLVQNLIERNHLTDVSIRKRIILNIDLEDMGMRMWVAFIWLRLGTNHKLVGVLNLLSL